MLLGGTVTGNWTDICGWEEILVRSEFKAITAPFNCRTAPQEIEAYMETAAKHNVAVAEIGVWKNVMDPDPVAAAEAVAYAKEQLALADRLGIPCCVNITGTPGTAGWDAADVCNFTEETYTQIIRITREIIDDVNPKNACYGIEPMPWMVPDGPDEYLQLIRDVDREAFCAHMDFVNMINCPRRYLAAEAFIEECFRKLAPYIRSTHLKDSRMDPLRLTTVLEECAPGEGGLNFTNVLRIIDRYLPADGPVLLEHMQTEEEYRRAYIHTAGIAAAAGLKI